MREGIAPAVQRERRNDKQRTGSREREAEKHETRGMVRDSRGARESPQPTPPWGAGGAARRPRRAASATAPTAR